MKTASIQELKQELQASNHHQLLELCLRLAKFKKENKELLSFLLFEAHDAEAYLNSIKEMIDEAFTELPKPNVYLTKKTLRKILRFTNRYIKYSGSGQVEAGLLIHFCSRMKTLGIPNTKSPVLNNLYEMQLKKITTAMKTLHEDIQYDLQKEVERL